MGKLMRTGAAADAIGVHRDTLRQWASEGLVTPATRSPRRGDMRWDLDELRAQLRHVQRRTGPAAAEDRADQPHPPSVVAAVVTSKRGVLAGRRNDGRPPWTLIAGQMMAGEAPADTMTREVKEETGLEVTPGKILGERVHPATGRHMIYVAARPARANRLAIEVGDLEELAEVAWLPLAQATHLMPGMFEPVLTHLRAVLRGAARGSGPLAG